MTEPLSPWPARRAVDDLCALEPHLANLWSQAAAGRGAALEDLLATLAAAEQWPRVLAVAEVMHDVRPTHPSLPAWRAVGLAALGHLAASRAVIRGWAARTVPAVLLVHAARLKPFDPVGYLDLLREGSAAHPDDAELALKAAWALVPTHPAEASAALTPHLRALGHRASPLLHRLGQPQTERALEAAWELDHDQLEAGRVWVEVSTTPAAARARIEHHLLTARHGPNPAAAWLDSVEWWESQGSSTAAWQAVREAFGTGSPHRWLRLLLARAAILSGQPYEVAAEAVLELAWDPPLLPAAWACAEAVGGGRLASTLRSRGWSMTAWGLHEECLRYIDLADRLYTALGAPAEPHRVNLLDYRMRTLLAADRVDEALDVFPRLVHWQRQVEHPPSMIGEVHVYGAQAHLRRGELGACDRALGVAVELLHDQPAALRQQAGLARAQAARAAAGGDRQAALAALRRAREVNRDSPDEQVAHALLHAELAPALGHDPAEAWHEALQRCQQHLGPGDLRIERARNHLAEVHLARGEPSPARALLDAAWAQWLRSLLPPCQDRVHTEVLRVVLDGRPAQQVERVQHHLDASWCGTARLSALLRGALTGPGSPPSLHH